MNLIYADRENAHIDAMLEGKGWVAIEMIWTVNCNIHFLDG